MWFDDAVVRLTLLAHASTEAQRAVRFPADEPLSQRGRRELGRVVAPVADRVVVAPERRTTETAAALGATAAVDPALRDLDYGDWAGLAIAVTHPAVIRAATGYALGAGPRSFWRIDVRPLARVRLHGRSGRWSLRLD